MQGCPFAEAIRDKDRCVGFGRSIRPAVWLKTMFFIESARFLRNDAFICKLSMVGGRLPKRNGIAHPNGNLSRPFDRHLGNGSFSGKRRFAERQRNMPLRRTANKWTLQKSQATRANFPDPNSTCKALQCQHSTTTTTTTTMPTNYNQASQESASADLRNTSNTSYLLEEACGKCLAAVRLEHLKSPSPPNMQDRLILLRKRGERHWPKSMEACCSDQILWRCIKTGGPKMAALLLVFLEANLQKGGKGCPHDNIAFSTGKQCAWQSYPNFRPCQVGLAGPSS